MGLQNLFEHITYTPDLAAGRWIKDVPATGIERKGQTIN